MDYNIDQDGDTGEVESFSTYERTLIDNTYTVSAFITPPYLKLAPLDKVRLTIKTKLKVQVVDCRSYKALANPQAKRIAIIDKEGVSLKEYKAPEDGYTVAAPISFNESEKAWYKGTEKLGGHGIAGQYALNGFGKDSYKCGTPSEAYGKKGSAAFNAFIKDYKIETDEIKSGDTPPEDIIVQVVESYNNRPEAVLSGDPNGYLFIPIPPKAWYTGFSIEIEFYEFAYAVEATQAEKQKGVGFTRYNEKKKMFAHVGFSGTQSDKVNENFGWFISNTPFHKNKDSWKKAAAFKRQHSLQVDALQDGENILKLHARSGCFSHEFNKSNKEKYTEVVEPGFTLLALQWCQPVYDDIIDVDTEDGVCFNKKAYTEDVKKTNLGMHIVTCYHKIGNNKYGNKGYGKIAYYPNNPENYKWRSGSHRGVDLHARRDDPVFAVHQGTVTHQNGSVVGNKILLTLEKVLSGGFNSAGYLHLDERISANGDKVIAGQMIGKAGRSGNLYEESYQPGHLHLDGGAQQNYLQLANSPMDAENKAIFPTNDFPLLLPCSCQVTAQVNGGDVESCKFDNSAVANDCWMVGELKCPFFDSSNKKHKLRRIQAQLRHLHEENSGTYSDPGTLDGSVPEIMLGGKIDAKVGDKLEQYLINGGYKDSSNAYRRVKFGGKEGWVAYSDLKDTWDGTYYVLKKALEHLIPGTKKEAKIKSKTLKAVYAFKKTNGLLTESKENDGANFQIENDSKALAKLQTLAPWKTK